MRLPRPDVGTYCTSQVHCQFHNNCGEKILSGECPPKLAIENCQTAVKVKSGQQYVVVDSSLALILTEQQQNKIDELFSKNNSLTRKVKELEERLSKIDANQSSNALVLSKKCPFSEVILNSSNEDMNTDDTVPKEYKSPSFFIENKSTKDTLDHFTGQEVQLEPVPDFKTLSDGTLKIQPKDKNSYSTICDEMNKRKTEYHSHQLKSKKLYRVVIRGLHPSTKEGTIVSELANVGHVVVRATNVVIQRRKDPNNKNVYKVNHVTYQKVTIEASHKKKEVPQGKNCQLFGHTQSYCKHQPRCVKCAGYYCSTECTKPKKSKPNVFHAAVSVHSCMKHIPN